MNPTVDQLPSFEQLSQMSDAQLTNLFGVRDFFIYEIDIAALAGNSGTAQGSFTVQADSNFLWQSGMMFADISHGVQTSSSVVVPDVQLTITDTGSGRQLMSAAVPVTSIFGLPGNVQPFELCTPRFFRAQTTVNVSLVNSSTNNTYNIKLQFIGTKFFKFAASA